MGLELDFRGAKCTVTHFHLSNNFILALFPEQYFSIIGQAKIIGYVSMNLIKCGLLLPVF
jgi:hypothetical protein